MLKIKDSFLIMTVFILLLSLGFIAGITSAAFKTPKFLEPYIPAGFVIDEKQCSSQDSGMFSSINIIARKVNPLPKPFKSPEFSDFQLGYVETTEAAYVKPMWQEARQKAEEESQNQTNPQNTFIGKETMKSGGTIYWYQGVEFNAQGAKDEAGQLNIYAATIIKQIGKGVLTIKITGFVGDRDPIRNCFK